MMIIRDLIISLLTEALQKARASGSAIPNSFGQVQVERPHNPSHGDFATNLPLMLARHLHMSPMQIAEILRPLIDRPHQITEVRIQEPGFINFYLDPQWILSQVDEIIMEDDSFGNVSVGNQSPIQVEFVSVNPTGPVHVGHARGAILGDALSNVLSAARFKVTREYYFNDAGLQMEMFYKSIYTRYQQELGQDATLPEGGYQGAYMVDIAREIVGNHGDKYINIDEQQAITNLGAMGVDIMLRGIQATLSRMRIDFDVWFKEHTLFNNGQYRKVMDILAEGGHVQHRDGAIWFSSTSLGEDKDNVLVRGSGAPTYLAMDIAYHYDKFIQRHFSKVIDIWGADHQGHVSRMKAAASALGIDPDSLVILITQIVTIRKGSAQLRASKRTGEMITLDELLNEVGVDACRFFFLARSPDSQMDFDIDLAKKESSDNPVYYIQYAYARTASILRLAKESKIDFKDGRVSLLTDASEINLVSKMIALPELIQSIATNLEPHHLPHYTQDLANAFHWFYQECRVISNATDDRDITAARLKLVWATQIVLGRCLRLMGMSTPEHM